MREEDATAIHLADVAGTAAGDLTFQVERVPPFIPDSWATCDGCGNEVSAGDGDCVTVALSGTTALRFHLWCFDRYVAGINRFMRFMRVRRNGQPIH